MNKIQIARGSRVLVKTRDSVFDPWVIKEGKVIETNEDCIKVEFTIFKLGIIHISRVKWVSLHSNSKHKVVLKY